MKDLNEISEITVSYSPKIKNSDRAIITSSQKVYDLVRNNWSEISIREEMKVLFLNRANKVLGIYELSKGGISGTVVDVRLLFAAALKSLACGIILIHNHPSGNLKPSDADIKITNKIREGAKLLDLTVYDHLIISDEGYYSFSDGGII